MKQSASQFFLLSTPDRVHAASGHGLPLAHMVYRIGNGPQLLRAQGSALPQGGLMVIGEEHFDGMGDASNFCQDVVRECVSRRFRGIVLDLDSKPTSSISHIISFLSTQAKKRSWSFYLPQAYSNYGEHANLMVSTAISGGTLQHRLEELVKRYGADRVTLCLERSAEDFFLPAPSGSGRPLSRDALQKRIKELSPSIFFSHELCAHYFTYMSRDSRAHFVLFDDVGSIRKKVSMAENLGIRQFFLLYSQMEDLLPELLRQ